MLYNIEHIYVDYTENMESSCHSHRNVHINPCLLFHQQLSFGVIFDEMKVNLGKGFWKHILACVPMHEVPDLT